MTILGKYKDSFVVKYKDSSKLINGFWPQSNSILSKSVVEYQYFWRELRILDRQGLHKSFKNAAKRSRQHAGKRYWEYAQRHVCFVNVQSTLHENVVFSVCARMCNAVYVISIMQNSISGLDACYHLRLNISCGVAVTVRSHQKKY